MSGRPLVGGLVSSEPREDLIELLPSFTTARIGVCGGHLPTPQSGPFPWLGVHSAPLWGMDMEEQ